MKTPIPTHHHSYLSENGINLKIVTQDDTDHQPVHYAHRDDYYIFGIIASGSLSCDIDFKNQTIREGELQFIRPGQVHRFVGGTDFEGWMLMLESGLVEDQYKLIFEEASVNGVPATVGVIELEELKSLFTLAYKIAGANGDIAVVRHLTSAFAGIVAGYFKEKCRQQPDFNSRRTDIVVKLNALMKTDLAKSHSPAYYAEKLNITPEYLNRVVKDVAGQSAGSYIRSEIVLQAKRMLYHTDLSIKEIAGILGFEDYAYFTRMFTKAAGKSPVKFRGNP